MTAFRLSRPKAGSHGAKAPPAGVEETPFRPVGNRNPKYARSFRATGERVRALVSVKNPRKFLRGKIGRNSRRGSARLRGGQPAEEGRAGEAWRLQKGTFS
jgi:hypothetical protein